MRKIVGRAWGCKGWKLNVRIKGRQQDGSHAKFKTNRTCRNRAGHQSRLQKTDIWPWHFQYLQLKLWWLLFITACWHFYASVFNPVFGLSLFSGCQSIVLTTRMLHLAKVSRRIPFLTQPSPFIWASDRHEGTVSPWGGTLLPSSLVKWQTPNNLNK